MSLGARCCLELGEGGSFDLNTGEGDEVKFDSRKRRRERGEARYSGGDVDDDELLGIPPQESMSKMSKYRIFWETIT